MLKLGDQSISALRLGGTEVKKAYLGDAVVFDVTEPPVPTYTISASIDPDGSGTVTGAGTYQAGETVTITAAPGEGYQFTGWQENGVVVSEEEAYTFTVTGDRVLVAVFEVVEPPRLPEGYTEIEYIENTYNTQTGPYLKIPTAGALLSLKISFPSGATGAFLGSIPSSSYFSTLQISKKVYLQYKSPEDNLGYLSGNTPTDEKFEIRVDGTNNIITFSGINNSKNSCSDLFSDGGELGVFGLSSKSIPMRLYSLNMYDINGDTLSSYVPCINPDGTVGVYDVVKGVFYSRANTFWEYDFTAGPAV